MPVNDKAPLECEVLRDLLRQALAVPHQLMDPGGDRRSAVLLPFVVRPRGVQVVFVRKGKHLAKHAGQLGFPGGGLEIGESALQAALREAEEEIALPRQSVEILGQLDDDRTFATTYHIAPLIGWIAQPPAIFHCDPGEIASVHEVDAWSVLRAEPMSWLEWRILGVTLRAPRYRLVDSQGEALILWGASARIVRNLQERADW